MAAPLSMTAGASGPGSLAPAAAALGPVGWAMLGVAAVSTVLSGKAASDAAKYERYQLKLAEQQGKIDAYNTMVDLGRDFRYSRGAALSSLGHSSAGIGESFLAVRTDELNLYSRDMTSARLSALAGRSQAGAMASRATAKASNQKTMSYLSLLAQGLDAYGTGKRLGGP
jgi:hypothetical protein